MCNKVQCVHTCYFSISLLWKSSLRTTQFLEPIHCNYEAVCYALGNVALCGPTFNNWLLCRNEIWCWGQGTPACCSHPVIRNPLNSCTSMIMQYQRVSKEAQKFWGKAGNTTNYVICESLAFFPNLDLPQTV